MQADLLNVVGFLIARMKIEEFPMSQNAQAFPPPHSIPKKKKFVVTFVKMDDPVSLMSSSKLP